MKNNYYEQARQIKIEEAAFRERLLGSIKALPENEDIEEFSDEGGYTCTIKASEMFRYDNWHPSFHMFKVQHEFLMEHLKDKSTENIMDILNTVINVGSVRAPGGTFKFHPHVRNQLIEILKREVF